MRGGRSIEKRFPKAIGQDKRKMLSIAVTHQEHVEFTRKWLKEIARGAKGTYKAKLPEIEAAARKVYADYPEILKALGL